MTRLSVLFIDKDEVKIAQMPNKIFYLQKKNPLDTIINFEGFTIRIKLEENRLYKYK